MCDLPYRDFIGLLFFIVGFVAGYLKRLKKLSKILIFILAMSIICEHACP